MPWVPACWSSTTTTRSCSTSSSTSASSAPSPVVRRNDEIDLAGVEALDPDAILISPGPGTPDDAGHLQRASSASGPAAGRSSACASATRPSARCSGATSCGPPQVMHGKTSLDPPRRRRRVRRPARALRGHPLPLAGGRSGHAARRARGHRVDGPEAGAGRVIMGLRHRELDVEGVQFHPESILTGTGHQILQRFLDRVPTPPLTLAGLVAGRRRGGRRRRGRAAGSRPGPP